MSQGYYGERKLLYLDNLFWGLITSSHILHKHGVFDAYGHVSARNPDNPQTFFLPSNNPPALLSEASEILEYKIEDGEPVEKGTKGHFAERFIHSEMYKRYPAINAVVHSHCREVLPYSVANVQLKPAIHTAGFLGANGVPVWEIESAYTSDDKRRDLLVRNTDHGRSLATIFRPESSTGYLYDKLRSAMPSAISNSGYLPGRKAQEDGMPSFLAVLMRGHGFTTCAESLEAAVYQAIYTKEAAVVQSAGLALLAGESYHRVWQGTVNIDKGGEGQARTGNIKGKNHGELKFLSDKEVEGTFQFARDTVMRPWSLWMREVEVDPLYRNEVKKENTEEAEKIEKPEKS